MAFYGVSCNESLSFIWDLEILENFKTCNLISSKHFFSCHNMQIWNFYPASSGASLIIRSQFSIAQSLQHFPTDPRQNLDPSLRPLTPASPTSVSSPTPAPHPARLSCSSLSPIPASPASTSWTSTLTLSYHPLAEGSSSGFRGKLASHF